MIFAFIDTNIYIKIISQGNPGCERSHFDDLKTMVRGGAVSLLLPEIVLIELRHEIPEVLARMERDFDRFREQISKLQIWNELASTKAMILDTIDAQKLDACARARETADDIIAFLSSEDVDVIRVSARIFQSATDRIFERRMPNKAGKPFDADCMIIESLVDYFMPENNRHLPDFMDFYFCSDNARDFFVELSTATKERSFRLHPCVQGDLPACNVAITLRQMLDFAQGYEKPRNPQDGTPLVRADDFDDSYRPEGPDDPPDVDIDSEESWARYDEWRRASEERIVQRFLQERMPLLPIGVLAARHAVATEIAALLERCRGCTSWDDKSEDNLSGWMEHESETLVSAVSLPKLIRGSLQRYLKLHREWSGDTAGDE